jgi:hypothetical protein
MAIDPRKRQKKLQRRASKRKEHRHTKTQRHSPNLVQQLRDAARAPVLHSWIPSDERTNGMGHVLISRELPNGSVAIGMFMVDLYCLGVKDAFAQIVGKFTYESKFAQNSEFRSRCRAAQPAAARKLVEGAVAYAANLGLSPHSDYEVAKLIFGDIDPSACHDEFEFGQNGKPHFMAGPFDSPARCKSILAVLREHCGPDGFHYTSPIEAGDLVDFESNDV